MLLWSEFEQEYCLAFLYPMEKHPPRRRGTCEGRQRVPSPGDAELRDGRGRVRRQAARVSHAVFVAARPARCGHHTAQHARLITLS